jgi:NADH:ubiquinone oxidoreductase subunit 2 (subunit N)
MITIRSSSSTLIGTLGAINQKKIKRLLAYSPIAHVGYSPIGLATGTIEAAESLSVYIVAYVSTIINVSGIISSMSKENYHSFDSMTASPWAPTRGAAERRDLFEIPPAEQGQSPSHDKVLAGFQNGVVE